MKRLIVPFTVALLLVLGIGCCLYGWPSYKRHKESRGLRLASLFLAKGDLSNASVSARQVLQINPSNAGACRIIAELAERSRSPAALDWTHRVADLAPTPANKLNLVACALRFERPPYPLAGRTLRELDQSLGALPAFHVLSAELALKLNRINDAVAHFEQASKLEPANDLHRFNLAVLQLQSTNVSTSERARLSIERLSGHADIGLLAMRWLIADDLRRNNLISAEELSVRLLASPGARLEDRLQHLAILQRLTKFPGRAGGEGASSAELADTAPSRAQGLSREQSEVKKPSRHQEFDDRLLALQRNAVGNPAEAYTICEWMGSHGMTDDALGWVASLDPRILGIQPMPLARANLYLAKSDWAGLETLLGDQKWADLEFLRQALQARAAWGRQQTVIGQARWASAIRSAGDRLGSLNLLLGLAGEWRQDSVEVLWEIGRRFPREQWALAELERRYAAARDTRGLNRVFCARLDSVSGANDSTNRNNFAATSMLLRVNLPRAHTTARDLYRERPADPIIVSTYAYSLHLQGRTAEGLAVLGRLKTENLEASPIALYFGLLLAASGDAAANRYLSLGDGPGLLPEEKDLLAAARRHR